MFSVDIVILKKEVTMLKGTKLYSILKIKCPRCQEGSFFEGSITSLSQMGKVRKECLKCHLKYSIEPSFYQGSYYVAYALGVALFITIWVLNLLFFPNKGPGFLFLSFLIPLIILSPILYRLSKIIWANLFLKFDKEILNQQKYSKDD